MALSRIFGIFSMSLILALTLEHFASFAEDEDESVRSDDDDEEQLKVDLGTISDLLCLNLLVLLFFLDKELA